MSELSESSQPSSRHGSKIPVRSRVVPQPQAAAHKPHTNQQDKQVQQQTRLRSRTKSEGKHPQDSLDHKKLNTKGNGSNSVVSFENREACEDKQKTNHGGRRHVVGARVKRALNKSCSAVMDNDSSLSRSLGSRVLKENVAPSTQAHLSASGPLTLPKKHSAKSNMSYMELKRRHQTLSTQVDAMEERSKQVENSHLAELDKLANEIMQHKESNALIKKEIDSCQAVIIERNHLLDTLQQQLEEIKFENVKIATVLEGSRIDALTGHKIERATHFVETQPEALFELENHELLLDDFIGGLENTISQLQEIKHKSDDFKLS